MVEENKKVCLLCGKDCRNDFIYAYSKKANGKKIGYYCGEVCSEVWYENPDAYGVGKCERCGFVDNDGYMFYCRKIDRRNGFQFVNYDFVSESCECAHDWYDENSCQGCDRCWTDVELDEDENPICPRCDEERYQYIENLWDKEEEEHWNDEEYQDSWREKKRKEWALAKKEERRVLKQPEIERNDAYWRAAFAKLDEEKNKQS